MKSRTSEPQPNFAKATLVVADASSENKEPQPSKPREVRNSAVPETSKFVIQYYCVDAALQGIDTWARTLLNYYYIM